ncbi:MAG: toast rack family protein [Anaerolineales bacterium]|jgi:hypothetical protein
MFRKILPVLSILMLGLSACGFSIALPGTQPSGPTTTDQITLPMPSDVTQAVDVTLSFGAGTLKVHSGTQSLVSGTATYNVADLKPVITMNGRAVSIVEGNWRLTGVPDLSNLKNEWDLALGNVPLNLTVDGGAYNATYNLGGLAVKNLTIKDGAAQSTLDFTSPNATQMNLLHYETGASNVSLTGLANANFTSLDFSSGAGNFTLDFSGKLTRDGSVNIETGVSNLTLIIPQGIPVQLTVEGGLSNVAQSSGWTKSGNLFTQAGTGPQLTMVVSIGAGNLSLTH